MTETTSLSDIKLSRGGQVRPFPSQSQAQILTPWTSNELDKKVPNIMAQQAAVDNDDELLQKLIIYDLFTPIPPLYSSIDAILENDKIQKTKCRVLVGSYNDRTSFSRSYSKTFSGTVEFDYTIVISSLNKDSCNQLIVPRTDRCDYVWLLEDPNGECKEEDSSGFPETTVAATYRSEGPDLSGWNAHHM
ncbi:unnamed protein product [Didymodactylos carnosus]|uniref:Uncharacterized protein n=1 Tax=Didymodactylos carnosus TaxID=1234261 RepID=A0A8S2HLG4_9BILA|nr:unnamed protein product [Didymodactylos carnosus]CAF3637541.1 unnamed protein product [Didymodactylos carnosus]